MNTVLHSLLKEEAGFVVSAELVLIATIVCLSLVVGLSEVSNSINNELVDMGNAISHMHNSPTDADQGNDFGVVRLQSEEPKGEGW